VEENPRIKRPALAAKLLGEQHESPDLEPRKAALASDLHYLILAGHVIEFADGTMELPLAPKAAQAAASAPEPQGEEAAETEDAPGAEASAEAAASAIDPAETASLPETAGAAAENPAPAESPHLSTTAP
jgi:hypothetical protein